MSYKLNTTPVISLLSSFWGRNQPADFKVYVWLKGTIIGKKEFLQSKVIKTVWYWRKDRHIDQWNRIENPEIVSHKYGQLIFDKGVKAIQWKKV